MNAMSLVKSYAGVRGITYPDMTWGAEEVVSRPSPTSTPAIQPLPEPHADSNDQHHHGSRACGHACHRA